MNSVMRLTVLIGGNCLAAAISVSVFHYMQNIALALFCGFVVLALATWIIYRLSNHSSDRFLKTMESALLHLKDGELSLQIPEQRDPQSNHLAQLFNQVIDKLRGEQMHLLQRDLMLNRVFETVSSALVLTDVRRKIVLCNPAARQLLNNGKPLRGLSLNDLAISMSSSLQEAILHQQNLMFTLEQNHHKNQSANSRDKQIRGSSSGVDIATESDIENVIATEIKDERSQKSQAGEQSEHEQEHGEIESWYLFCENFQLHGYEHCLYHFQPLTQALARSEVDIWKKVIRVFSHELNNSLAPVSSLAYSGLQLIHDTPLPSTQQALLTKILTTVQERSAHLHNFLSDYAQFSRLPTPAREPIDWLAFLTNLQGLIYFCLDNNLTCRSGFADTAQLSQVLINLIKNAYEAGASEQGIMLEIKEQGDWDMITISDDGSGMGEEQLKQAMLPFYSTKRNGTGLGLALCREIIEAHNGRIHFTNRPERGLKVSIWLPAFSPIK